MPIYKVIKNGKWGRMDTILKGGKMWVGWLRKRAKKGFCPITNTHLPLSS